jgi:hypothetical protein
MGMASKSVAFYLFIAEYCFLHSFHKDMLCARVEILIVHCVCFHHGFASKDKKAFFVYHFMK